MSPQFVLALILVGPPPADSEILINPTARQALTADSLRDQFRDLTRRTSRTHEIDAADVVPDLVSLYHALHEENDLPGSELVDMRRRTQTRLEKVRERLLRDRLKLQQAQEREERRNAANQRRAGGGSVGVGIPGLQAELANAQQLIDVITQTIEPQTWEENGGKGSIRYFAPLHVLVIRNTAQVHEQIGGALGNR